MLDTAHEILDSRSLFDVSFMSNVDKSSCIIYKKQVFAVSQKTSCSKKSQENVYG